MSKVVLITGGSSGIGKETALKLLKKGYIVCAAARSVDKMRDIENAGGYIFDMDLTDQAQIQDTASRIIERFGRVDILINNAGYGMFGAVEEVSAEDARRQFDVNLFGPLELAAAIIPYMRSRGWGRIINISSMGGRMYTPLGGWYYSSKYALEGISDSMRSELKPFGIKVILIEPGMINSPWYDIMGKNMERSVKTDAYRNQIRAYSALVSKLRPRMTPPEKVARSIVRAASAGHPRARYTVGLFAKPLIWFYRFSPAWLRDGILCRVFRSGKE